MSGLSEQFLGTRPEVTVYEDSALGIRIENQREVRVDSAEQAIRFMDEIMRARKSGKHMGIFVCHHCYRTSHLLETAPRYCTEQQPK